MEIDNIIGGENAQTVGVTVTLNINECIKEVHLHYSVIVDADKKMEHWRKKELDAALACGENLVKIRQQYGKKGVGFKTFIATEFANEFSYETCLRYMKLFNGRSELTADITCIRQAYLHLGILRENYDYPKPPTQDNSNPSNGGGTDSNKTDETQQKSTRQRSCKKTKQQLLAELLPHNDSFVLTFVKPDADGNNSQIVVEFKVESGVNLLHRVVTQDKFYSPVTPNNLRTLIKRIRPIAEWYWTYHSITVNGTDDELASNETMVLAG